MLYNEISLCEAESKGYERGIVDMKLVKLQSALKRAKKMYRKTEILCTVIMCIGILMIGAASYILDVSIPHSTRFWITYVLYMLIHIGLPILVITRIDDLRKRREKKIRKEIFKLQIR